MVRRLYTLILCMLMPVVVGRLIWRGWRNREYWRRWGERFGRFPSPEMNSPIWIHAVSVGEVRAAQPLVREIKQRWPAIPLLVTTTTPTGSEQVKALFGESVLHTYLPYDLPGPVKRFLDGAQPRLALIMETELWPNLFHGCASRKIPIIIANARLSARSLRGYRRVSSLIRETLRSIYLVAAQGEQDAERFRQLGMEADRIRVTGSMKFDQPLPEGLQKHAGELRRRLGEKRMLWIAASTHQGEEEQILDALRQVRREHPDCLLMLVPRHPERFGRVAELCSRAGFRVVRRSSGRPCDQDVDIFLGDTMGELMLFYAASDVAFVGGSLVPTGGHNMLEPAALGKPVIAGPHLFNFTEIAAAMERAGALCRVADGAELAEVTSRLLSSPEERAGMGEAGRRLVQQNRGALQRVLDLVRPCLEG